MAGKRPEVGSSTSKDESMTASSIASPPADKVKSRFLTGLASSDRATILAAASQRRGLASSVVANQGEPAAYLFLLTKGCARYFYIPSQCKKVAFFWLNAVAV